MKLKIFINSVCFVFLFFVILLFLSKVILHGEFEDQEERFKEFYEENTRIDAIFIGASSTHYSWLPVVAWREFGITSLNFASPGVPLSAIKYLTKEAIERKKPKLIVINIDSLLMIMNKEHYLNTYAFLAHIKFSLNKILMIDAINKEYQNANSYKYVPFESVALYFPIIRFHEKWKKLITLPFSDKYVFLKLKGTNRRNSFFTKRMSIKSAKEEGVEFYDVGLKNYFPDQHKKLYLDLLGFLTKLDTRVILINTPFPEFLYDQDTYKKMNELYKELFFLAGKHGINYIDLRDDSAIKAMNLKIEDFYNNRHFNYYGAIKYTHYLGSMLKEKFNLQGNKDKLNDETWAEAYRLYEKYSFNIINAGAKE